MNRKYRVCSLALIFAIVLSIMPFQVSAQDNEVSSGSDADSNLSVNELPSGATFREITDLDVENATLTGETPFIYIASELNYPVQKLTPVFFVYPDKNPANEDEAFELLDNAGLISLAEQEKGVILLQRSVNSSIWSGDDINVYNALLLYIHYDFGVEKLTQQNLIYALGEGSGADFINEKLSQNANRIAGVATFGGNSSMPSDGVPLPAYIAGANEEVLAYYCNVNETDLQKTVDDNTVYYNSTFDRQQVMINDTVVNAFDAIMIRQAWRNIFRFTTRTFLTSLVYEDPYTDEVFTLLSRPNVDELGLQMNVCYEDDINTGGLRYYEWVPEEAIDNDSEKFPLVLVLHGGGDHEVYEAESNGWVDLAAEERFIVVAPYTNTVQDRNLALIEEMLEKYSCIDQSRIYITGFSQGSSGLSNTLRDNNDAVEVFAAAVPFSWGSANNFPAIAGAQIPFSYHTMEYDDNTTGDINGSQYLTNQYNFETIRRAFTMNDMEDQLPNGYDENSTYFGNFWRFQNMPEDKYITNTHGFGIHSTTFYNNDNVPMIRLSYTEKFNHAHYPDNARLAWDYMCQFQRDPETKEIIYTPDEEGADYSEGVTVSADADSPTGYNATFVYVDDNATDVVIRSGQFGFYEDTGDSVEKGTMYGPDEWRIGLYPGGTNDVVMTNQGNGVFTATVPLPSGAYLYQYRVSTDDGASWISITDPANPPLENTATGSKGANSVLYMPFDSTKQEDDRSYVMPRTDGRTGTLDYLSLNGVNGVEFGVAVYLPYGYDENRAEPYKVIYLSHGNTMNELEWMNDGCIPNIMDNLIADGDTEPAIVVTMHNTYDFDRPGRGEDADHSDWTTIRSNIMDVLLPAIESMYNASEDPMDRAFGGESMGGMNASQMFYNNSDDFSYFGVWSGSYLKDENWDNYDLEAMARPLVMSSAGSWDTNRYSLTEPIRGNDAFQEHMDAYGLTYVGPEVVQGAHAFETWHQIYYIFASEYLWTLEDDNSLVSTGSDASASSTTSNDSSTPKTGDLMPAAIIIATLIMIFTYNIILHKRRKGH